MSSDIAMKHNSDVLLTDEYVTVGTEKVKLPASYDPFSDAGYMHIRHLAYFKLRLLLWRAELQAKIGNTLQYISKDSSMCSVSDEGDVSSADAELFSELRTGDRYRKLVHKIDRALLKIETGDYGFCEKSGVHIGLRRLFIRPIAMLSVEMQELHEKEEDMQENAEYTHKVMMQEMA